MGPQQQEYLSSTTINIAQNLIFPIFIFYSKFIMYGTQNLIGPLWDGQLHLDQLPRSWYIIRQQKHSHSREGEIHDCQQSLGSHQRILSLTQLYQFIFSQMKVDSSQNNINIWRLCYLLKVLPGIDLSNKYFIKSKDAIKNVYVQHSCGNIYDMNESRYFQIYLSLRYFLNL